MPTFLRTAGVLAREIVTGIHGDTFNKARLHRSISLINAIESTKLNRVNSTFQ
jgi:hypothetical protein